MSDLPRSPKICEQNGPAMILVRSSTRIPARGYLRGSSDVEYNFDRYHIGKKHFVRFTTLILRKTLNDSNVNKLGVSQVDEI